MFRAFLLPMTDSVTMTLRRRLRFKFEAFVFSLALRGIPTLPRMVILRIAATAGYLAWWLARRDRKIAMANLDLAFGDTLSSREKHAIVRKVFSNFVRTGLDYFWFSRDRKQRLERWVVMDESLRPWMRKGALVAVTAHFGNWEILGWLTVYHGSLIASVAKPVKNPLIDAEINRLRRQSGQLIIPRDGAIRSLVRVLKQEGTVALLLDQDTLPSDGGIFVPFFGVPAPIATAAGGLALKLKTPMIMAFCTCDEKGVYRAYCPDAFLPADLEGMTANEITVRVTECLEREIRKNPGCWLWTYKRWKRRLPDFDASRYPFYADC